LFEFVVVSIQLKRKPDLENLFEALRKEGFGILN